MATKKTTTKTTKPKKPEWEPKRRPHKPKLTPPVAARIIRAMKAGNYLETAARVGGIHVNTLNNWLKWGTDHEEGGKKIKAREPFRSFAQDLEEAMAQGEDELVRAIQASGWKGKLEILTRRHPQKWGRTTKLQLTGVNDGPIMTKSDGPPPSINITVVGDTGQGTPFVFEQPPDSEEVPG